MFEPVDVRAARDDQLPFREIVVGHHHLEKSHELAFAHKSNDIAAFRLLVDNPASLLVRSRRCWPRSILSATSRVPSLYDPTLCIQLLNNHDRLVSRQMWCRCCLIQLDISSAQPPLGRARLPTDIEPNLRCSTLRPTFCCHAVHVPFSARQHERDGCQLQLVDTQGVCAGHAEVQNEPVVGSQCSRPLSSDSSSYFCGRPFGGQFRGLHGCWLVNDFSIF